MILFYNVFNSFFVLNETYNTNKKNMSEISKKKKKEQRNDTMETFVLYEECLRFFLLKIRAM